MAYVPGGADLIDIAGGGMLDRQTVQWFENKAQALQNVVTGAAQSFFDNARSMYQIVSETQALQMLRNIQVRTNDVWSSNQICYLHNLESIQNAGPIMQRWIMAQPDVRQRYLNQQLEGYGESYTNFHGNNVGWDHYDYRRVMTSMVEVSESDEYDWVVREAIEYQDGALDDLGVHARLDIRKTWDRVKHLLEEGGEDPTSTCGNLL